LCNHPQAHIAKCGDIQILMLAITFNNKKTRYVTTGWEKKRGIFLFKKYILQNGENSPPGFFLFYYSLRGIRVLLELPR
jgi:hypothetical protein